MIIWFFGIFWLISSIFFSFFLFLGVFQGNLSLMKASLLWPFSVSVDCLFEITKKSNSFSWFYLILLTSTARKHPRNNLLLWIEKSITPPLGLSIGVRSETINNYVEGRSITIDKNIGDNLYWLLVSYCTCRNVLFHYIYITHIKLCSDLKASLKWC